jgi:hypothetical protein
MIFMGLSTQWLAFAFVFNKKAFYSVCFYSLKPNRVSIGNIFSSGDGTLSVGTNLVFYNDCLKFNIK